MYRKTYALVKNNILTSNIKEIRKKYNQYDYYFGVVKNNAYHHGMEVVNALESGGINYFAVSSLEEAMDIRKYNVDTPILILEPIDLEYVYDCINHNITLTIENNNDLEELLQMNLPYELKIHLKLDTGMNRLGFKKKEEVTSAFEKLSKNDKIQLEGIYSHFATSGISDKEWDKQVDKFKKLTEDIDLSKIPIVHFGRSLTLVNHPKLSFCNGIRLGIVMYGFAQSQKTDTSWKGKLRAFRQNRKKKRLQISETTLENDLKLKTAFSLYSTVMSIRPLEEGEFVGYNALFHAKEDSFIATIPIGYADGVDKSFQYVSIHHQKYPIVADTMDMIMVLVDNKVKIKDTVEIFGEDISIKEVTKNTKQNAYHLFNQIQNRIPRIHQNQDEEKEIKY